MNSVILVGRLTRDPELRTTPNGIATCQISLAVNGLPNQNGERTTDFINVVVWRRQAENVAKFCQKGSQVGVEGKIHTRIALHRRQNSAAKQCGSEHKRQAQNVAHCGRQMELPATDKVRRKRPAVLCGGEPKRRAARRIVCV